MMANGAHRRVGTRLGLRDAVSPTFLCTAVLSATPTVAVSPCLALLAWLSIISGESQLARCASPVLCSRGPAARHVKTSAPGASRVAWTLSFLLVSGVVAAMDLICPDGSPAFIEPLTTSRAMNTLVDGRGAASRDEARASARTLPRYFGYWHGPAELALTP